MPSKSILEQKQAIVAALAEQLKNSPAGVVVNYQGITVDDDTKMRKALREAGVDYKVMKNSMTGRACDEVGLGDMKQYLVGMTAIAIGKDDAVAPAKVLKEYAEKIESFQILGGYLDGKVVDASSLRCTVLHMPFRQLWTRTAKQKPLLRQKKHRRKSVLHIPAELPFHSAVGANY